MNYVLVTVFISYIDKKTDQQEVTYTKVEDTYPNLIVTNNLIGILNSTDKYKITGIEYDLESVNFKKINKDIVNTWH